MTNLAGLEVPLVFRPVYQTLVWGGRRMERWRGDLPAGPIGESWDLSDHDRGMSVVATGPLAGTSLRSLTAQHGREVVGDGFSGGPFPLMLKLIDATDRLSVQVHPDDLLARKLGVGNNGKTECWLMVEDGGTLYQGTRPGVDRHAFEAALAGGAIADTLNQYDVKAGDFFFLDARTVHALGAGCLLFEVQQTCDVTFRVYDWGRMGLDGKPRPMHVKESLETIDFSRTGFGPRRPAWAPRAGGGQARVLADCAYFTVEERRGPGTLRADASGRGTLVTCISGGGALRTAGGSVAVGPMQTALVPAVAGAWQLESTAAVDLLVSTPRL